MENNITQDKLKQEIEARDIVIAEQKEKLWDAYLREENHIYQIDRLDKAIDACDSMRERRDNLITQISEERDSYAKLLKEAEAKIENLEFQIEQRSKLIQNAHNLLVIESKRLTHFEKSLKESLA